MTYLEGINSALREEMRRDERVFCLGEDIGVYGGAFKITKGLIEEFGPLRVLDTPLSESAIVGVATGAALMGMRPVVEMQFSDFITCAFNQVVNMSAKIHYRWGARVPMVIRCPSGGGVHGGPFHSQNPESWFFHVPGLKVVTPATAADAKGLLTAAIRDNNPVMYFEHKFLYRRIKDDVPEGDHVVPIGVAICRRPGKHMSVITYGSMVHVCLEAAEKLQAEGCEAEIIDLRSLLPFDKAAVLESVQRTGKALIVHEDTRTGGVGAEFAAIIAEEAFESLDGPVRRVASIDTPVPYSPPLEEFFMPSVDKVLAAMQDLAAY
ncbi:MAG: alpha-ketoacid dehydrogenase subunit beta [Acidobacteriota bacterium]|nr:alpha-ketoacid dehydrogenase subunit beta [Acidobacteriota bacterium]